MLFEPYVRFRLFTKLRLGDYKTSLICFIFIKDIRNFI